MLPSPRALILNLLVGTEARGQPDLSARELLAACAVFGLEANSARVALTRGVAAGLLVTPRRGVYALGPQARALADEVNGWPALLGRLAPWSGSWVAVHVGATGRSDRSALRQRERAFSLLGLAEFERGLHLRPDNLAGGCSALRRRLAALLPTGTEAGTCFLLGGLSAADQQRARSLWDVDALNAGYRDATAQLAAWMDGAASLPADRAAREVFGLGNDAIRRVVFDPLLPAEMVDAAARARFVDTVIRFDGCGKAIWQGFLGTGAAGLRAHAHADAPARRAGPAAATPTTEHTEEPNP